MLFTEICSHPCPEERFDLCPVQPPFVQGVPQYETATARGARMTSPSDSQPVSPAHLKPAGFALVLLSTFGDGQVFLEEFRKQSFQNFCTGRAPVRQRKIDDLQARASSEVTMTASPRVLLINPTITSHRHARFPLAILSLSASLDGKHPSTIIDGNVDRDFISTAVRAVSDGSVGAVGRYRHGKGRSYFPQSRVEGDPRETTHCAHHLGRRLPDRLSGGGPERALHRLRVRGQGRIRLLSFWMRSLSARMRR